MTSALHAEKPRVAAGRRPAAARVAARAASFALLALALAVFVGIAVLPHVGLYRPVTVLSQSMRPTFAAGDLLIVTPEPLRDVRRGQVVTYQVPVGDHYVETHRVVQVRNPGAHPVIRTRGDANNADDPWSAQLGGKVAWRLRLVIPYGGWFVIALRSHLVHLLALFAAPLLAALFGLAAIWGRRDEKPCDV